MMTLKSSSTVTAAFMTALAVAAGGVFSTHLDGAPAETPPMAHIRVWKADLHDFPVLRVTVIPAGNSSKQHLPARELVNIGPGYMFGNYLEVPAGHSVLNTFDAPAGKGAEPRALVSLPVDLAPTKFVTVLIDEPQKPHGPPRIEVIVDDVDDAASAQFTVRSLDPEIKDVHVALGDTLTAQFSNHGGYLQMRGLHPDAYTVHTSGLHRDGKPFDWNTSVDFKQHTHQTLLIYPDPYGHVRPRLSVDGEAPEIAPADKDH